MNVTHLTNARTDLTLPFGRYMPLLLIGSVCLGAALLSHAFSLLDAWLGSIALVAALVHLVAPAPHDDHTANTPELMHRRHDTDFTLANVSSSVSIAASLTIVVVLLLQ